MFSAANIKTDEDTASVRISIHKLTEDATYLFLDSLCSNSSIQSMTIIEACYIPNMLDRIIDSLNMRTLRYLQITASFTTEQLTKLGDVLIRNTELQELNLSICNLTAAQAEMLATPLLYLEKLTRLNLSNNFIGFSGVKSIVQALVASNCPLQYLNLESCQLNSEACQFIGSTLPLFGFLQTLKVGRNLDISNSMHYLTKALHSHPSVVSVGFNWISLTASDINAISDLVMNNKKISKINLSNNAFSQAQLVTLTQAFACNKNIQTINFAYCEIDSKKLALILDVLSKRKIRIVHLSLTGNPLKDCAALLANQLSSLQISCLFIDRCGIDEGLPLICDAIQRSTSLKRIRLYHNKFPDSELNRITACLQPNPFLVDIDEHLLKNKRMDEFIERNRSIVRPGYVCKNSVPSLLQLSIFHLNRYIETEKKENALSSLPNDMDPSFFKLSSEL